MYQTGDWVNITPEESMDECPVLGQIMELVGSEPQYWIDGDWYGMEHIAPIPLTEDILERNEWLEEADEDYTYWYYTDPLCPMESICIVKTNKDADYYDFHNFRIHYVHELQQAMRLWFTCNAEDLSAKEYKAVIEKIKNFKIR